MLTLVSLMAFAASLVALHRSGFRLLGVNAHPLAFLLWSQVFVFTIPGVLGIGLAGWPMSFDMHLSLSDKTKDVALWSVFFSLSVLLLLIAGGFASKLFAQLKYDASTCDVRLLRWLTVISHAIFAAKIASITEVPLLLALKGEYIAAGEAKVRILQAQEGITIFGLNYVARSFTHLVFLIVFMAWLYDRADRRKRWLLVANIPVSLANAAYDVQKYTLVLLVASCAWLAYTKTGKAKHLVRGVVAAGGLSAGLFALFLGSGEDADLVASVATRIFVSQAEGLFLIYEWVRPGPEYAWLGMPLAGSFDLPQIDPAAEVVKIIFPGAGDAWLNVNSYYIAHAWTIFGNFAVIVGPVFVFLNLVLLVVAGQRLIKRNSAIFYPLVFWFVIRLPIMNIFTEFMWFKVALDFLMNAGALLLVQRLFAADGRERRHVMAMAG